MGNNREFRLVQNRVLTTPDFALECFVQAFLCLRRKCSGRPESFSHESLAVKANGEGTKMEKENKQEKEKNRKKEQKQRGEKVCTSAASRSREPWSALHKRRAPWAEQKSHKIFGPGRGMSLQKNKS